MRFVSGKVDESIIDKDKAQLVHCELNGGLRDIARFRKHSDLHGFLTNIWLLKNPDTSYTDFNCDYLEITPKILSEIEMLAYNPPKMHYSGPFWGESTLEDWEETKTLCEDIEKAFDEGERVFYFSWW